MREHLEEQDAIDAEHVETRHVLWIAEVNRSFHLQESLRETAGRRWWDVLAMKMVLVIESERIEQARAETLAEAQV